MIHHDSVYYTAKKKKKINNIPISFCKQRHFASDSTTKEPPCICTAALSSYGYLAPFFIITTPMVLNTSFRSSPTLRV